MLLFLRILFSVLTVAFATYGLITKNYEYQGYMILFMGLMALVMGIKEIQQKRKMMGWFFIIGFVFTFCVAIQGFIFV